MNSKTLEKLFKRKNYVIYSGILDVVKEFKLNIEEFILLIYFLNEDKPSLNVEKIEQETKLPMNKILEAFTTLSSKGLISIKIAKENNIAIETVDLDNVFKTMVNSFQIEVKDEKTTNIFTSFEKEFARTLSPMEYEIINNWLSNNISEEIILGALKEATFNGVTNLRYIDKIIFEWSKKGFKNMNDVKSHMRNRDSEPVKEIKEYNWLDEE